MPVKDPPENSCLNRIAKNLAQFNSQDCYGSRYGIVAERREIFRVTTRLAAHPRTPTRRIDVIDPGSRDPGTLSGAGARLVQLSFSLS